MLRRLFGDYTPWIEALCEADPAFPAFIMKSDLPTRHFICAVLAYSEITLDDAMDPDLATELRKVPRAKVLTNHIGEHIPGLAKALGKLTGKPWHRYDYQSLQVDLFDAETAKMLGHMPKIRPVHLDALRRLPKSFRRYKVMASIRSAGDITSLIGAVTIASRVRKDMCESALARSLEQAISVKYRRKRKGFPRSCLSDSIECTVSDWLENIVSAATFKTVPWEGTNAIRPLRSGSDMRRCARHFENCLEDHIVYAATGLAGYFEHIAEPRAVVQVQQVGHLGWAITDVRGPKNITIGERDLYQIEDEFLSAGFMPRFDSESYIYRMHLSGPN